MGNTNVPPQSGRAERLLARAQGGDPEAFCLLATEHEQRLLRQAFGLCRDFAAAEDLVAETMVEGWRSLGRFDGTCRFSTWLFSILLHRHQKQARRAQCRPTSAASLPVDASWTADTQPDERPSPAEQLLERETADALLSALQVLPEKQRQVLLLRFFQDCSLEEISAVAGCSMGTVKSRLHYALEALRKAEPQLNLHELRGDT